MHRIVDTGSYERTNRRLCGQLLICHVSYLILSQAVHGMLVIQAGIHPAQRDEMRCYANQLQYMRQSNTVVVYGIRAT